MTWTRTVDCRTDRRQALMSAIGELPAGVTWDLVIHSDGCFALFEHGDLSVCDCHTLVLEAEELR